MTYRVFIPVCCALWLALTSGCGPKIAAVSGSVTFKGKPLKGAAVSFNNPQTGFSRETKVRDDGSYEVKILAGMGLPPGKYLVAVYPPYGHLSPPLGANGKMNSDNPIDHIPVRYRNFKTSGLVLELPPEGKVFPIAIP